jgi:hypothetical protein
MARRWHAAVTSGTPDTRHAAVTSGTATTRRDAHDMAGKAGRRGWGRARKLPSGRWQASYVHDLVRHTAPDTFKERTDAEGWLADGRRLINQNVWTPPKVREAQRKMTGVTFGEYATTWIEDRPIKASTKIEYERLLGGPLEPLQPIELRQLNAETIRSWFAKLSGTPRRRSHAYGLAHAVLATAVADDIIAANLCRIARAMNTPRKREPVIVSVPEVEAVAEAIQPPARAVRAGLAGHHHPQPHRRAQLSVSRAARVNSVPVPGIPPRAWRGLGDTASRR